MLSSLRRLLSASGTERFAKTGVIDPPNVIQSQQGRYYLGRTGLLAVPGGHRALVLLHVPEDAVRRAFVVTITVTSNVGRRAVYQYGTQTTAQTRRSNKVACAHRGEPDEPQAAIEMATGPDITTEAGVGVHERLLIGGETLVLEQEGRLILEQGEAVGVWFDAVQAKDEIDVAFGWWEEPMK